MNIVVIVIANILAAIGMSMLLLSTILKEKKQILGAQSINHALSSISGILLKGYSGAIQDIFSLLRNICVILNWNNKILNMGFVIIGLILGVVFNNMGFLGLLPIVATVAYAIVVVHPGSKPIHLKLCTIFCAILWSIYSFIIQNYANVAFNILTAVSASIAVIKQNKKAIDQQPQDK